MEDHFLKLEQAFHPVRFTPQIKDFFENNWILKSFPKSTLITSVGAYERYFYFVLEGVQALYLIDRKGDLVILGFSYAGDFSGVYHSYLKGQASDFFLEAMTDTQMLGLPLESYNYLMEHHPEFNLWGRIFHQNLLIGRVQREVELMTLNAKDRYDRFMARCPDALRTIPQKYLASYLNMTPETFSRVRKEG